MEPVRRLLANAGSLEEVRDGMAALYAEMPSEQLPKAMQKAIAAAELSGRADVSEGE